MGRENEQNINGGRYTVGVLGDKKTNIDQQMVYQKWRLLVTGTPSGSTSLLPEGPFARTSLFALSHNEIPTLVALLLDVVHEPTPALSDAVAIFTHIIRNPLPVTGLMQVSSALTIDQNDYNSLRNRFTKEVSRMLNTESGVGKLERAIRFYPELVQAFVVHPEYEGESETTTKIAHWYETQNSLKDLAVLNLISTSHLSRIDDATRTLLLQGSQNRDIYGQEARELFATLSPEGVQNLWKLRPDYVTAVVNYSLERNAA